MLVTIFAKDNDKPGNRELIEFLKMHFTQLLENKLTFEIKLIESSDIPDMIKRGLDKLPAATIQGKNFTSSVEIKSILMKYLSAKNARKIVSKDHKDPEDDVRDFYKNEMSFDAVEREKEQEEFQENKKDLMGKYQQELQRRSKEDEKNNKNNKQTSRQPAQKPRQDNVSDEFTPVVREKRVTGAEPGNVDDKFLTDMLEETY